MSAEDFLPIYPVYIISKGRHESRLTAKFLEADGVPYRIVVEPQETEAYAEVCGAENVLTLPFSNLGLGGIPARNWIWEHAIGEGHYRHWILDDNIRRIYRLWKGRRIPCEAGPAFRQIEDFTDRYENIAISGMNYKMFGLPNLSAYFINSHVYSCLLIRNDLPNRWRGRYNEDTDLCLQVLGDGHCTVLVNVFLADKLPSMTMKGGNTDELYLNDGRLEMAQSLERNWPGVVTVDRRWQRPQHVVDWRRFKQPLIQKEGLPELPAIDEYGLKLYPMQKPKSPQIVKVLQDYWREHAEV
jgi:hypothetical protein